LLDANLMVYAAAEDSAQHSRARAWVENQLNESDGFVGICWASLYGFVRLVSNRMVMGEAALPVMRAWAAAEIYLGQPATRLIDPGPSHPDIASRLVETPGLSANDVPDVYLAALAIEHGLILATHDHGFGRFVNLNWEDPLAPDS